MAYKKRTLRTMSPTARKVARLIGEMDSIARRLKNLVPDLQKLDLESRALETAKAGFLLSDTDAWGLQSAIIHGQQDGYFNDNAEWAQSILERLEQFRAKQG